MGKYVCYFFFASVSLLGSVFIYLVVPETKGRTEEDMREYFSNKADSGRRGTLNTAFTEGSQ